MHTELMVIQVLNAPSYFSKIWFLVKRFVDPNTASKLVILTPDEVIPTLTQTIDLENIPVQYGGGFAFEHGMVPKLDEGLRRRLEWLDQEKRMVPTGPLKWKVDKQGRRVAIAVGVEFEGIRNLAFARLNPVDRDSGEEEVLENGAAMVSVDSEVKVIA